MEDTLSLTNEQSLKRRNWVLLLAFGLLLNIIVSFTSDLGLDTHVHMARDSSLSESDEATLPWGHTRPLDSMASNPEYSPSVEIGWYHFLPNSENGVHFLGFSLMCLLLFLTISIFKINGSLDHGISIAAIVAIHPTFIFATGRAFPETIVAIFTIGLILGMMIQEKWQSWTGIFTSATISGLSMGLILFVKGINPWYCVIVIFLMLLWHSADNQEKWHCFTRSPSFAIKIGTGGTLVGLLLLGILSDSGTFSTMKTDSLRFSSAFLVASIDVILIYGLFGMILWPIIGNNFRKMWTIESHEIAGIVGLISVLTTAITFYIAALWTYESKLWDADWPWMMWTMGNNGRYISMLMVPTFFLMFRIQQIDSSALTPLIAKEKSKAMFVGICLVIPLSLLTAIHGQTMWTDDAAEILSENMEDGDDFLFVHDATLGMHYLYTFYTEINDENTREITGHWRDPNSQWEIELFSEEQWDNRGNLSEIQWIVLAPGIEWENAPEEWKYTTGQADFMNGGGEWKIYTNRVINFE